MLRIWISENNISLRFIKNISNIIPWIYFLQYSQKEKVPFAKFIQIEVDNVTHFLCGWRIFLWRIRDDIRMKSWLKKKSRRILCNVRRDFFVRNTRYILPMSILIKNLFKGLEKRQMSGFYCLLFVKCSDVLTILTC